MQPHSCIGWMKKLKKLQEIKERSLRSKTAPPTAFGQPPKGLSIDFFDHQLFNNRSTAQKTIHADTIIVAFLPDSSQSIQGIQHPDEKLSHKKFIEKYWDELTQKYELSHEIPVDEDYNESNSGDEDI
ncbi:hypothetical protein O181_125274 [Austropuccinia psidii MF-1]|uniref:Uncharacterized protein n=1 Tax=Austropuccinia psidii MF-1 TaxID=1389203 RepID=A0A9Q3Q521_9BASI|nr:hypothetical protein [Austropuccinia psidii MF-1]